MALAWCIANKDCTIALMGFSRASQVAENIQAVNVLQKWSPELDARLDEILGNKP